MTKTLFKISCTNGTTDETWGYPWRAQLGKRRFRCFLHNDHRLSASGYDRLTEARTGKALVHFRHVTDLAAAKRLAREGLARIAREHDLAEVYKVIDATPSVAE